MLTNENTQSAFYQMVKDDHSPIYRVWKIQAFAHVVAIALQTEDLSTIQINHIQCVMEYLAEEIEELGGDMEGYFGEVALVPYQRDIEH